MSRPEYQMQDDTRSPESMPLDEATGPDLSMPYINGLKKVSPSRSSVAPIPDQFESRTLPPIEQLEQGPMNPSLLKNNSFGNHQRSHSDRSSTVHSLLHPQNQEHRPSSHSPGHTSFGASSVHSSVHRSDYSDDEDSIAVESETPTHSVPASTNTIERSGSVCTTASHKRKFYDAPDAESELSYFSSPARDASFNSGFRNLRLEDIAHSMGGPSNQYHPGRERMSIMSLAEHKPHMPRQPRLAPPIVNHRHDLGHGHSAAGPERSADQSLYREDRTFFPNPNAAQPTPGFPYAFPDPGPPPGSADRARTPANRNAPDKPPGAIPPYQRSFIQASESNMPSVYSRTPELRTSHMLAERKRRKEMKDLFDELRDSLPIDRRHKTSKWEILSKAIDFIELMKTQQEDMTAEMETLRAKLSRAGI